MVVSNIKPINKKISAYYNYIFGPAHNGKEERNMSVYGLAGVEVFDDPDDMYEMMKIEREIHPNKRRKHEAYTVMISFSKDEIDPNNPEDVERAKTIVNESISGAYPNRSAVVAIQSDGLGGNLHAHVLLNNVDSEGRAINKGWRHMKEYVNESTLKNGLEPLDIRRNKGEYDWWEDLEGRINAVSSIDELEGLGVSVSGRWRKKDGTTQLTFKFEDEEGKTRKMRGRRLAAARGIEDENVYCLERLEEKWKQQEEERDDGPVIADMSDLVEEQAQEHDDDDIDDLALDFGGLEQGQGLSLQ